MKSLSNIINIQFWKTRLHSKEKLWNLKVANLFLESTNYSKMNHHSDDKPDNFLGSNSKAAFEVSSPWNEAEDYCNLKKIKKDDCITFEVVADDVDDELVRKCCRYVNSCLRYEKGRNYKNHFDSSNCRVDSSCLFSIPSIEKLHDFGVQHSSGEISKGRSQNSEAFKSHHIKTNATACKKRNPHATTKVMLKDEFEDVDLDKKVSAASNHRIDNEAIPLYEKEGLCDQTYKVDDSSPFILIRSASETYEAIASGKSTIVDCPNCDVILQISISGPKNVFCSTCEQIFSVNHDNHVIDHKIDQTTHNNDMARNSSQELDHYITAALQYQENIIRKTTIKKSNV